MILSFFHGGEGLAVAVALEDETYPIDELVFDLANIRAGPRFAGEDAPTGGGSAFCVSESTAGPIIQVTSPWACRCNTAPAHRKWCAHRGRSALQAQATNELLRHGDIESALVEWRSILRHIVLAPAYPLSRWTELKAAVGELIDKRLR